MATESQFLAGGNGSRLHAAIARDVVVTAGATTIVPIPIPAGGSWLASVRWETKTAFSGTPTNINGRVGTTSGGAEVVADTDVKAQGHVTGAIVASFDSQNTPSMLYAQIAAVGGTAPAGTATCVVSFYPPN